MFFKCKMCGGDIEPIKNTNTGKCIYCKSVMTLPNLDDEKIVNLYNRANSLRIDNEFDKSKEVYEKILEIDNKQIEAHWGILLCKYGVEYVDDAKTKKKIPTCHRTNDSSIFNDNDYKIIKKEAYGDALKLYEEEAKQIDELQKKILDISKKEKPYDVFICYKETDAKGERTKDSVIAQDIYDKLQESGLKVFFARITLEDKLGKEYEPYIYSALKTSKVMLVVGTTEENFNAVWVKNEWSRFLEMMRSDKGKTLIPVYSKIDAYKLPEEFSMLQAQSMDKVGAIQDLTRGVKKVIDEYKIPELTDVDDETINKVQKALEEAKPIGNGNYEVNIVKDRLPVWYYFICILSLSLYSLFRFILFNVVSVYSLTSLDDFYIKNYFSVYSFEILFTLILVVYFILLFINRKTHKIAKKMYPILITLALIRSGLYLNNYILPRHTFIEQVIFYFSDFIVLFVSHIVTPSWNLDTSSKQIMNLEEKNNQVKKNETIRNHFKRKEFNKENKFSLKFKLLLTAFVTILCIITIFRVWKILPYRQSNDKNESLTQILVKGTKVIYANKDTDSKVLASVRDGDYYDILNFSEIDVQENLIPYGFAQIKTNKGIEGYLFLGNKGDNYSTIDYRIICSVDDEKCKNKFSYSNKRDESVLQLQITNEQLRIREEPTINSYELAMVTEGDIFTILDTYTEEITERKKHPEYDNVYSEHFLEYYEEVVERRVWYKIKTSNDIVGWVCQNVENEVYLELLEKK